MSSAPPASAAPPGRDLSIDLVRVACVLLVVFVHLVLVGVGRNPDGSLLITSGLDNARWATPASWAAEIMPLFFVIGGFTARIGWDSARSRSESASAFVRKRLDRLAHPALPLYTTLLMGLLVARLSGVPADLLEQVATPVGSILWFLGAYLTVQALAPFMIRLHAAHPYVTAIVLLLAALVVDVFRLLVGIHWLGLGPASSSGYGLGDQVFGLPNMALVWLFCQQLGFFLHDGVFAALSRVRLVAVMAASVLALFFGPRLMTVYLWRVPAICACTAVIVFGPWPLPTPGSGAWWWSRPLMLVVVLALVWVISLPAARLETPRPALQKPPSGPLTAVAAALFILPSAAIALYGLDLPLAIIAVLATGVALGLTAPLSCESPRAPAR